MDGINDFVKKQEALISLFKRWNLCNGFTILKSKMEVKMGSDEKTTEENRCVFERALSEVQHYGSVQGYANMHEIENDLMEHADKYPTIKIRISELLKYPDSFKMESKWLDALLDNGVINQEERFDFCFYLENCAKVMVRNVKEMNLLLDKYGLNKKTSTKDEQKQGKYSRDLLSLFHHHTDLINELVGKSDKEKAAKIKEWSKGKDKFGKPLIENPNDFGEKTLYAKVLKSADLIRCSERTFRDYL